jgi:hypothetical protein
MFSVERKQDPSVTVHTKCYYDVSSQIRKRPSLQDKVQRKEEIRKQMKGVFWDVTLCSSCKNRRFGGT